MANQKQSIKEKKEKGEFKGMIGLEIHAYVQTQEKLFCTCRASREKGLKENVNICPICTGQPGSKPMLPNKIAVEKAIQIALMLKCNINKELVWQRKHYDWPDMPKGYQNTLSGPYAIPVGEKGKFMGINIWSMHLEEDPASWNPETGCVDYNRSGLPLVEIITSPDFSTSEEVMDWLKKLVHSLSYLKAIDRNAGIKADVNVSLQPLAGSRSPATERVEIKNISSIEDIGRAIEYELERQMKEGSERETRRFDSVKGKTEKMRSKEQAEDYRFISDPDLQEIVIDDKMIKDIEKTIPESPQDKLQKLIKKHKIGKTDAEVLAKNIDIVEFFEKVVEQGKIKAKEALHWVTVELLRVLNYNKKKLDEVEIGVEHFAEVVKMVLKKEITELQGKQILNQFIPKSFNPREKKIQGKITNEEEIKEFVDNILAKNAGLVEEYRAGKKELFNFLMGEVMKESNKRADFAVVRKVLERELKR